MLKEVHWDAMMKVLSGADVFDVNQANLLRMVEILYPEFILIGDPLFNYLEEEEQPLFGAVLTRKGKDYLNAKLDEEYLKYKEGGK